MHDLLFVGLRDLKVMVLRHILEPADMFKLAAARTDESSELYFLNRPGRINPQTYDFQISAVPAKKTDGLLNVLSLVVLGSRVSGTVVVADDGDSHGIMDLRRYCQSIDYGLD
jgi:hypothetical protein